MLPCWKQICCICRRGGAQLHLKNWGVHSPCLPAIPRLPPLYRCRGSPEGTHIYGVRRRLSLSEVLVLASCVEPGPYLRGEFTGLNPTPKCRKKFFVALNLQRLNCDFASVAPCSVCLLGLHFYNCHHSTLYADSLCIVQKPRDSIFSRLITTCITLKTQQ